MTDLPPPPAPAAPQEPAPISGPAPAKKGFAITSLVLGIVAILGSWIPFLSLLSIPLALAGVVFGIVAIVKASKGTAGGKVMAIVGAALSALAVILAVVSTALGAAAVDDALDSAVEEIAASAEAVVDDIDSQEADPGEAEPAPVEELVVADQQYWVDDSGYWNYYVLIQNPSDEAVYDWESFDVELVDVDGVILDSDSSYPTVLPESEVVLAGMFFDTEGVKPGEVAGLEVRGPVEPTQFITPGEAGSMTVDAVEATNDDWSVTVTGTVESTFVEDQEMVTVAVVAFDADGNAVAQDFTFIDRLPTGGKARFEISMYDIDTTDGLTFEVWAML